MTWDHRKFASINDPMHKSHLSSITGDYGCAKSFEFDRRADRSDESHFASGKSCAGNAAHEVIARALTSPNVFPDGRVRPITMTVGQVAKAYDEEFERAVDGRELVWGHKDKPATIRQERLAMLAGLLSNLHKHVAEIVAVERAFIAQLGSHWISGHIDLIYRPVLMPDTIAMCDWKTGARLPDPIVLEHGFESGFYSQACRGGIFIDRAELEWEWNADAMIWTATHAATRTAATHRTRFWAERECLERALIKRATAYDNEDIPLEEVADFGEFPSELRYVHLADYVPYTRKGDKIPTRPEQQEFFGVAPGEKVKYVAGDLRGPAWYPMRRTEHDVPRLEMLARKLVRLVRMGVFFENITEKCRRCSHRDACLTSGYELRGQSAKQAKRILGMLPPDAVA